MKAKKSAFIGLAAILAVCLCGFTSGIAFSEASAEVKIENSDYSQFGTGVGAVPSEDPAYTDIVLPYTADGHAFFGSGEEAFAVDMTSFKWNLKINALAVGQSFAISFIKDTGARPFDGAEGVSFVFESYSESVLRLYILDAKDGTLLQEMIDTQSQWAYQLDGAFPEDYPKSEEEGYSHGMVGRLSSAGTVGQTLQFSNVVDAASFGGTTNRPGITSGNTLGTTVPGTIFENRGMNAANCVLVLSAGGQNGLGGGGEALSFTVNAPTDKKTVAYNNGVSGIKTSISAMVARSEAALKGTLSGEEYAELKKDFAAAELSALRPRDRFIQQNNLNAVGENLARLNEKLADVSTAVKNYSDALEALEVLGEVTAEKVSAAREAREAYEDCCSYIEYLEGDMLDEVRALVSGLNEKLLARGEIHLQICAYEEKTSVFKAAPGDALPADIYAAEQAGAAFSAGALDELDEADKTAFGARIAACDELVARARQTKAYDVEAYKLGIYRAAAEALSAESSAADFESAFGLRPELKVSDILPADRVDLQEQLKAADGILGGRITAVMRKWYSAYSAKTDLLDNLAALTKSKIDDARAARYEAEAFEALCFIVGETGYDASEAIGALKECDRKVEAAGIRLLVVAFSDAANGRMESSENIEAAYQLYLIASEADTALLSETEEAEFRALLESSVSAYEAQVKELLEQALKAFEDAVGAENISSSEAIGLAKEARSAVPSAEYLIVEADRNSMQVRYDAANEKLMSRMLYYAEATGTSWSVSESERGLLLNNRLNDSSHCDGLAVIADWLEIDGFDFAFEFTRIGRIWKGEDPVGSGKYPQSVYVMNILNEPGKTKDEAQGFSLLFFLNQLDQIEVSAYGPNYNGDVVLLAQGVLNGVPVTAEPYEPISVRVRVEKDVNNYRVWINSLQLNIYYRDFINHDTSSPAYMPEFPVGNEIGENIYRDGKAYVTFVVFAESLTEEERESSITVRMIGDRTFGGYVAPVYTVSVELVSGPDKTTYAKGEAFDKTGIRMTALLSDGSLVEIPLSEIKVLGFVSTSKGTKNVTLSYTDESGVTLTKVIKVTIVDAETPDEGGGGRKGLIIGLCAAGGAIAIGAAVVAALVLKSRKNKKA